MPKERTTTRTRKVAAKPERNQRRKKDPNAPKRGLSAYMFFANDNRDKVREDNPGISFGEVGKNLGAKWRGLDDDSDEKKLYNKKAADDKKRYEEEMAAYRKKLEEAEGDSDKESGSDQE